MPLLEEKKYSKLTLPEQEFIYEHYGVRLFYRISSPLRLEDNPSFSTYEIDGNIRWKDFGTGDGGDIYSFIMQYESVDFLDATKIAKEILKGSHVLTEMKQPVKKHIIRSVVLNESLRDYELEYWAKRGISKEQLMENDVHSLKMLLIDNKFKCTSTKENPKFVYMLGHDIWKLYSPLESPDLKWMSHNINRVNYESEPQRLNNELIIFSSKKDKMVFDTLNLPYDTTSVLAEGNYAGIIKELHGRFSNYKNVYCLLDFDSAGERSTQNIESKSEGRIKGIYLPMDIANYFYTKGVKDIDEVMISFGRDNLLKLIKKIL